MIYGKLIERVHATPSRIVSLVAMPTHLTIEVHSAWKPHPEYNTDKLLASVNTDSWRYAQHVFTTVSRSKQPVRTIASLNK